MIVLNIYSNKYLIIDNDGNFTFSLFIDGSNIWNFIYISNNIYNIKTNNSIVGDRYFDGNDGDSSKATIYTLNRSANNDN